MTHHLMNETEAARVLGGEANPISVHTLRKWRTQGCGPKFIRIGNRIRYRQSDLDAFIERQVRTSTAA
jgi:hypothetical protein